MDRRAGLATFGAVFAFLMLDVRAYGQDPTYELPIDSLEEQWGESDIDELIAEESTADHDLDIARKEFLGNSPLTAWSAGTEAVAFHTRYLNVAFAEDGDDKYDVSPRYFVGWEGAMGFGVRSRYWRHDADGRLPVYGYGIFNFPLESSPEPYLIGTIPLHFEAESFDLDFYKRLGLLRTNVAIGAGVKTNEFSSAYALSNQATNHAAHAVGPSFSSEIIHVLHQTEKGELSFVSGGRASFMTGETRYTTTYLINSPGGDPSATIERDIDMTAWEASLGLEWKRILGWGVLVLRGQYETQLWNSDGTDEVSFNGGTIRAGVSW